MTTNAFLFSWDCDGIEAIVPITQYENFDVMNTFNILADKEVERNPLNSIMQGIILRAQANPQRFYEVYAIDCDDGLDEDFWREQWEKMPQETADMIREHGMKIFDAHYRTKERKIK